MAKEPVTLTFDTAEPERFILLDTGRRMAWQATVDGRWLAVPELTADLMAMVSEYRQ